MMGRYVTVSVKVPIELRDRMKKLGIKASSILRRAIEDEVRRRELVRLKAEAERLRPTLLRIPVKEVVRGIREDRERR